MKPQTCKELAEEIVRDIKAGLATLPPRVRLMRIKRLIATLRQRQKEMDAWKPPSARNSSRS